MFNLLIYLLKFSDRLNHWLGHAEYTSEFIEGPIQKVFLYFMILIKNEELVWLRRLRMYLC